MEEIVIWNKQPSIHDIRQLLCLSKQNRVFMISDGDIPLFRIQTAQWAIQDFGDIRTHFLSDEKNPRLFVRRFISEHQDAIHFVCGLRRCLAVRLALNRLLKMKEPRLVLCMESPNKRVGVKRILQNFYYRQALRRCRAKTSALLAVGQMGAERYRDLGFPAAKIFPTMYGYANDYPPLAEPTLPGRPLKLIYVGEAIPAKGVPLLLEAVSHFSPEDVHLDFVGSDRMSLLAQALNDAKMKERVSALGIIPNDRIPSIIADHDLLILPSLNDGWGMVTTEAIIAGIGAVVTDACGSQDVVRASGAGRVIPSGSVVALTDVIADGVDHPETLLQWKRNARSYRDLTRPEVIADYSRDVLNYVFQKEGAMTKPRAPWLDEKKSDNDI